MRVSQSGRRLFTTLLTLIYRTYNHIYRMSLDFGADSERIVTCERDGVLN